MGEVYKARDTRLERTVALKVLPTHSIPTDDARRRFEREAKAVSQLSHPHICALFDVGREAGIDFLVMELVDGETLQSRLGLGPLPLADVLRYGAEIADALDRAHRSGIAHRDLKPGNVMVTKSGVKLLDFGLARAIAPVFPGGGVSGLKTATAYEPLTHEGAIVGTLQYMAPEQLEGKPADARSDVFALGCVLYEMASGRRAFAGSSAAAVASGILHADAPPLATLRTDAPSALGEVVRACLVKDPDERWQSAHDVKLVLEGLRAGTPTAPTGRVASSRTLWLAWTVAAVACLGLAATALLRAPQPSEPVRSVRFQIPPPAGTAFAGWTEATTFALSPDGGTLAFVATDAKGRRVYLRALSALEPKPLEVTAGALSAFWSPDGKSLAFFADRKLKRLDLDSGTPVTICDVRPGAGITGSWGADGQILFASIEGDAIYRVKSEGGQPEKVCERDLAAGVQRVTWPSFLPDGRRYLYLIRKADRRFRIMLGEPGRPSREVAIADSFAQHVAPGYLVFARDGTLLAQRFEADRAQLSGDPIALAEPVDSFGSVGWASFAVSPNGVLAYASDANRARLGWFDRAGHHQPLDSTAAMLWVRFSPDGRRALFNRADARTGNLDIWALDVARGVEARLTSDPDTETWGLLLPGGDLVYSEPRTSSPQLFRRDLATGETRELQPSRAFQEVQDVTPDGKTLVFAERIGYGAWDLFTVDSAGGPARPLLQTPFDEIDLRLSPDGRSAAFVSNEPGRSEIYVAPFPRLGERVRLTQEGAYSPRWSRDGRELYYLTRDRKLVAVSVSASSPPALGAPRTLFTAQGPYRWSSFDVAPDGRFLAIVPESLSSEQPLTVLVGALGQARDTPRR
jgi:Tol biopolymer transport system component